nr:hypothetical protein [Streptomyces lasiicapitis]
MIVGEALSQGVDPVSAKVVAEDPLHHGAGGRVDLQAVGAAALGGLGRVRVRTGVREAVAVGRAAAQEPALQSGLGGHRGADAQFDAAAFGLAHPAEHRHHQVMGFRFGVDGAADLRHPQLHAVVHEEGVGQAVLVAVEGALRLADDHRVEVPGGVGECGEQICGAGAAFPGDRAGLADVEVLGHHRPVCLGERCGAGQLPRPGGGRVLLVLGGDPAVEREAHHYPALLPSPCSRARARETLQIKRHSAAATSGVSTGGCSGTITLTTVPADSDPAGGRWRLVLCSVPGLPSAWSMASLSAHEPWDRQHSWASLAE